MKLNNFLIKKFIISLFISNLTCLLVFFIFSIIGNLGENFSFFRIFTISIINSMQLIFYIPTFILFLTIFILWYLLNIKNEIVIIRQFLSKAKILFILLIFIISFTIIETRKDFFIDNLEKIKMSLLDKEKNFNYKLIVLNEQNTEKYFLFKDIDLENKTFKNFNFYEIVNDKIKNSIYAEKQSLASNSIYLSEYYMLNNNIINKNEYLKTIKLNNLIKLLKNNNHTHIIETKKESMNIKIYQKLFHFLLLNCLIILILFNHSTLFKKDNSIKILVICIFFIIYSYSLFTINLQTNNLIFIFIGTFFIFLHLIRNFFYE